MNTLYDLVKRIDALTANSQQVLNALIRSCIATGSSSGYTVRKFNKDLKLTRADIYHLYDFYNAWEQAGFPSDDTFDAMLSEADNRWRKSRSDNTTAATDAVVVHSKILYMTASNQNKDSDDEYWIGKIKDSVSAKAVVGTAPIPLNLRTPLYDENLSTKSFSQYETYLFPIGYQRMALLGTPYGDDDYAAGGKTWEIDTTDYLRLNSTKHITMGMVVNNTLKELNYGESVCTFSWGDNTYAFGSYSFAAGKDSIAVADRSFALGTESITYGIGSFAMGANNISIGHTSMTMNAGNRASGTYSLAANYKTVTGGYPYRFTVKTLTETTVTNATVYCEDNAQATEHTCKLIDIPGQTTVTSQTVLIVTVNKREQMFPFDLKEGDTVNVFYLQGHKGNKKVYPTDEDGYAYPVMSTEIISISSPEEDESDGSLKYTIKLRDPVTSSDIMPTSDGYIQVESRKITMYGKNMVTSGMSLYKFGAYSTALNYNTVANGISQTVVGTNNQPNLLARFIVGTGLSDIDNVNNSELCRANGLAIASQYGYFKLYNNEAGFSVSAADSNPAWDNGFHMYKGAVMRGGAAIESHSRVFATEPRSMMITIKDGRNVAYLGTAAPSDSFSNKATVCAIFSTIQGTAVISSGSYIKQDNESKNLVDTYLQQSGVVRGDEDNHCVAIYSENGTEMRSGDKIHIWANSYLCQTFTRLILNGNTYGALPATDKSLSHVIDQKTMYGTGPGMKLPHIYNIGHSGFYSADMLSSGSFPSPIIQPASPTVPVHIFNSTTYDGAKYHTVGIAIPEKEVPASGRDTSRPVVSSVTYPAVGANMQVEYSKELAYLDDVKGATSSSLGMCWPFGYSKATLSRDDIADAPCVFYPAWSGTTLADYVIPVLMKWKTGDDEYKWTKPAYATYDFTTVPGQFNGNNVTSTWVGGNMHVYKYNGDASTKADRFTGEPVVDLKNLVYSITGNALTISFSVEYVNDDLSGDFTGIVFPLVLGCAFQGDYGPQISIGRYALGCLTGTAVHTAEARNTRTNRYYDDRGMTVKTKVCALVDRLGVVHVRLEDIGIPSEGSVDYNKSYRVELSGIIPWIGDRNCCGEMNRTISSTSWSDSTPYSIFPKQSTKWTKAVDDRNYIITKNSDYSWIYMTSGISSGFRPGEEYFTPSANGYLLRIFSGANI